jgi:hypothetical protein
MKNLISAIKSSTVIDSGYIEEQLLQIDKLKISPLTEKVIDSYKIGDIVLLYSNNSKIPQFFPFIVTKNNGRLIAFVFLSNYGKVIDNKRSVEKSSYMDIPTKDLYALMEGAFVALSYAKSPHIFTRNYGLMSTCMQIYVGLFNKILNREYALVMDREAADKASFIVAKFFLERVWGCENTNVVFQHALNVVSATSPTTMGLLNEEYNTANVENLEDMINLLKTVSPRLAPINLRYFMQCFINQFKASAIFATEVLPYFFFVVQTTMIGSFVVNQTLISDVVKNIKTIGVYYQELNKAI